MIIVECPGLREDDTQLRELSALTGATITWEDSCGVPGQTPLGIAATVDVSEENVVTFSAGESVLVVRDAREVMVIHTSEEDPEMEVEEEEEEDQEGVPPSGEMALEGAS